MTFKLLFSSLLSLGILGAAHANKVTINVANFTFTPANTTINLGDTVQLKWLEGDHTTTSGVIPGGAASWDSPITSTVPVFEYVPTVAGVYNYVCTPHADMGQIGKFTVTGTSDISEYEMAKLVFNLYPNPAQSELTLVFVNTAAKISSVMITDITGKTLLEQADLQNGKMTINVNTLSNGTYFVRVAEGDRVYVRKFTISR